MNFSLFKRLFIIFCFLWLVACSVIIFKELSSGAKLSSDLLNEECIKKTLTTSPPQAKDDFSDIDAILEIDGHSEGALGYLEDKIKNSIDPSQIEKFVKIKRKCYIEGDSRYWERFFDALTEEWGFLFLTIFFPIFAVIILVVIADVAIRLFLWIKTGNYRIEDKDRFIRTRFYASITLLITIVVLVFALMIKTKTLENKIEKEIAICEFESLKKNVGKKEYIRACMAANGYKVRGDWSFCYDEYSYKLKGCYEPF